MQPEDSFIHKPKPGLPETLRIRCDCGAMVLSHRASVCSVCGAIHCEECEDPELVSIGVCVECVPRLVLSLRLSAMQNKMEALLWRRRFSSLLKFSTVALLLYVAYLCFRNLQ